MISSAAAFIILRSYLTSVQPADAKPADKHKVRMLHNPCRHVSPEPVIIFQEKFQTLDTFFPASYKERKCAGPSTTRSLPTTIGGQLQTCFTENYYCITRYDLIKIVRIPYPGNVTYTEWKIETDHVAVGCECSSILRE